MRRIPILPTLLVVLAIAGMIALGIWQLRRAGWKDALLAQYAANAHLPEIAYPIPPRPDESLLYRPAHAVCTAPVSWVMRAGHSADGQTGWRHIALCRSGVAADLGWSTRSVAPVGYAGGPIRGALDWDPDHVFLIVADQPAPGLVVSARPSPANIPNNHRGYAVQWFLFAGVAALIYALALRQKLARKALDR